MGFPYQFIIQNNTLCHRSTEQIDCEVNRHGLIFYNRVFPGILFRQEMFTLPNVYNVIDGTFSNLDG